MHRSVTCFERKVLIEIRKANAPPVIERFRRYLGQQIGSRDNILTHPSGRTEAVPIAEEDYPAECGFVLRQLHEAMAEEEVRRNMVGEDLLLRDSMLLARQVEHHERRAARERERAQRAEQGRQQAEQRLARAIRRLHRLGQNADAVAAALAVDVEQVRRVLSA